MQNMQMPAGLKGGESVRLISGGQGLTSQTQQHLHQHTSTSTSSSIGEQFFCLRSLVEVLWGLTTHYWYASVRPYEHRLSLASCPLCTDRAGLVAYPHPQRTHVVPQRSRRAHCCCKFVVEPWCPVKKSTNRSSRSGTIAQKVHQHGKFDSDLPECFPRLFSCNQVSGIHATKNLVSLRTCPIHRL